MGTEGFRFTLHPKIKLKHYIDSEKPGPGTYEVDKENLP